VRVPELKPGSADSSRIEYRVPDAAANPYLAFAAVLAAGLDGIEQNQPLPAPVLSATDQLSPEEVERRGLGVLPSSLGEAIERFEGSNLMRETLGEHVHETLIANKKLEWAEYRSQVTAFEISRYLPML
jgi:glutamine synthetase